MTSPTPEQPAPGDVVARSPDPKPWVRIQLVVNALLLLGWGSLAVRRGETVHVLLTCLVALALALNVAAVRAMPRVQLVLLADALEVRRRARPVRVARDDVVAVRGDVPGRPSWSEHVLVDTPGRTVRLPPLDRSPGEMVPLLQQWAGVGERPDRPQSREPRADRA